MPRGMMTTSGIKPSDLETDETLVKMPKKEPTVIPAPVLEEGVDIGDLIEAEHAAKAGLIRTLNTAQTYMKKLQKVQEDAGIWCGPRGVANPVSAIGGSHLGPNVTDELQKLFDRYVAAIRKGAPLTLEGLSSPLS